MLSPVFGLQILDRRYDEEDERRYGQQLYPPGTALADVLEAAKRRRLPSHSCLRVIQCTPDGDPLFVHFKRCAGSCPLIGGIRRCEIITKWGRGDA